MYLTGRKEIKMFTLSKEQIGEYLGSLIREKGYKDRQFSIECLRRRDGEVRPDLIQNMQNRICQIKKGRKWIQVEDLPIFSDILGVSIEELLSAGAYYIPDASRMTNYSVAFSKDRKVWEEYINNAEGIFVNYDEYGKSVIDYALQFKNYEFMKYLLDEGIIWFVGDEEKNYFFQFGAGTKIKRRVCSDNYSWEYDIATKDKLRTDMIALAIEKHDSDVLDELKARETPELYFGFGYIPNNGDGEKYFNQRLIDTVARADSFVLKYFSETFSVVAKNNEWNHCIFPDEASIVDELIKLKSKRLKDVLLRIEKHNTEALKTVQEITRAEIEASRPAFGDTYNDEILEKIAKNYYFISENKRAIRYSVLKTKKSFAAIIIKIDGRTENPELQKIIDGINITYDKLIDFGGR